MVSRQPLIALFKASHLTKETTFDKYSALLQANGYESVVVPTLAFEFSTEDIAKALELPNSYSGLIFTSPRSVEAVSLALKGEKLPDVWQSKTNYSVGEKTKEVAEDLLRLTNLRGASSGSAEVLAPYIVADLGPGNLPLLFPCSSIKLDTLPLILRENGIRFEAMVSYNTIPHAQLGPTIESLSSLNLPKFMVFFSPSGVNFSKPFLKDFGMLSTSNKVICIGATTAKAAEDLGLHVDKICAKPTPDSLLEAVKALSL